MSNEGKVWLQCQECGIKPSPHTQFNNLLKLRLPLLWSNLGRILKWPHGTEGVDESDAGDFRNVKRTTAGPEKPACCEWLVRNLPCASEDCEENPWGSSEVRSGSVYLCHMFGSTSGSCVPVRICEEVMTPRHRPPVVVGAADWEPPGFPPGVLIVSTASCSWPANATRYINLHSPLTSSSG